MSYLAWRTVWRCYQSDLLEFMDSHVYPAEAEYDEQMRESGDPNFRPPILEELKAEARRFIRRRFDLAILSRALSLCFWLNWLDWDENSYIYRLATRLDVAHSKCVRE